LEAPELSRNQREDSSLQPGSRQAFFGRLLCRRLLGKQALEGNRHGDRRCHRRCGWTGYVKSEYTRWGEVVKKSGITAD